MWTFTTSDILSFSWRTAIFKIADKEKRIRENPLARTLDILKKVFGK